MNVSSKRLQYPLKSNITNSIATYVHSLTYDRLPEKTKRNVALFFVDYVAACCAGYALNISFNQAFEGVVLSWKGAPESSVLFHKGLKVPAVLAGMLNASYAHGADFDDGNKKAMGHVGAHVFSSVFALAESRKSCRNRDVVEALVVGYDVFCRLAAAAQPGMVRRGFHSTGYAGAIACAAACAKLLKLSEESVYHALALAATQASGLLLVGETGQEVKPINPAKAVEAGILSALLAERGVVGPKAPLESDRGWFHAATDSVCPEAVLDELGSRFALDECYLKPYPSCRHTHCVLEAVSLLRDRTSLDRISSVQIEIYQNAIRLAGGIEVPKNEGEAKFSIKYAAAIMLSRGHFGLCDLDPSRLTAEEFRLIQRTKLVPDDSLEDVAHGKRGARVTVCTVVGERFSETVDVPLGDPEHPATLAEISRKLAESISYALDACGIEIDVTSPENVCRAAQKLVNRPNELFSPILV